MSDSEQDIGGIRRFFEGAAFPTFSLALLLFYDLLLIALFFTPVSETGLGAFAESFRIWCANYDPTTGRTDLAYALAMVTPPWMLAGFLLLFWWKPLHEVIKTPLRYLPQVLCAGLIVLLAAGSFAKIGDSASTSGELPFAAEALRTEIPAPNLDLVDQRGQEIRLSTLRGQVVLLTAVYTSCHGTCPAILSQTKLAIDALPTKSKQDLSVIAITMDPQQDTPEVLAAFAKMHRMNTAMFHFVTGEPEDVERVLDAMNVGRKRDPQTGVIAHANLFLLIDRSGKLAYRLGLGARQQRWLASALSVLLEEKSPMENP